MKYVVCNLKNKMVLSDFQKYHEGLKEIETKNTKLIVCFSAPYLMAANSHNYDLGSQDITSLIEETVTGEITGYQLANLDVRYVLVGHSERRIWKKEINIDFINKITEAQNNNLKVIYCIGESLKERENNQTKEVLEKQILEVLNNINLKNLIIAYEPVWAIGTGNTPTKEEIKETVTFINKVIKDNYDLKFPLLYGGSINLDNINEFATITELDGFLIGGASLDYQNVQKIIDVISQN